jgi:glycerate kinase
VGFALSTWGATLTSGAAFVAEATHLSTLMDGCDILLTGEGRFDRQSLTGKVVGSILTAARERPVTVGAIVGTASEPPPCWYVELADLAGSARAAIADPRRWLIEAGRAAASNLGADDQDPRSGRAPTVVA